jgi:hypothetical protein
MLPGLLALPLGRIKIPVDQRYLMQKMQQLHSVRNPLFTRRPHAPARERSASYFEEGLENTSIDFEDYRY